MVLVALEIHQALVHLKVIMVEMVKMPHLFIPVAVVEVRVKQE
jgi:hypothetical protein